VSWLIRTFVFALLVQLNVADAHPDVVKRLQTLAEEIRQDPGDGHRLGANERPIGRNEKPIARILSAGAK